jgi:hypothetical protein
MSTNYEVSPYAVTLRLLSYLPLSSKYFSQLCEVTVMHETNLYCTHLFHILQLVLLE